MVNNSSRKYVTIIILVVLGIVLILVPLAYFLLGGESDSGTDGNKAPVLDGYNNPYSNLTIIQGRSVVLTVSASDPDGDRLIFTWKLDGIGVSPTTSHTYQTSYTFAPNDTFEGAHTIEIKVSDGNLHTTHTWKVTVLLPNRAPTAIATVDTFEKKANKRFSFDGSGSSDPDGDTLSYLWTFGDGETSRDMSPHWSCSIPGSYTIVLEVSDREYSATDTIEVTVTPSVDFLWKTGPLSDNDVIKILVDDVDNDGSEEMVVGSNSEMGGDGKGHGRISIYDLATQELEWSSSDIGAISDFELENVDDDPAIEIVVGVLWKWPEEGSMSGYGYVFDGKSHSEEWKSGNIGGVAGVEIGNADDDPALELVFSYISESTFDMGTFTFNLKGGIIVIGSDFSEEWRSTDYGSSDVFFVGDLDGDSSNEILISTSSSMGLAGLIINTSVISWTGCAYDEVQTRNDVLPDMVRVADLDGDNDMEIIAAESSEGMSGLSGNVTVYDHTLSTLWNTDDIGQVLGLTVDDVDGDGKLEILAGGVEMEWSVGFGEISYEGYLYIFDYQGNQEWKSEKIGKVNSIVTSDLQGGNRNEIALMVVDVESVDQGPNCFILVLDGSTHAEVSRIPTYQGTLPFNLVCVDGDGDGKDDLLFGSTENGEGYITLYKLN